MIRQAVILAAGEGERLRPFTASKPKVMIPVANKPVLQYVIETLALGGIRRIVIVVGYRREQVLDFLGSGEKFGVEIDYVMQDQQLGTAHALKQAKGKVSEEFLVVPGDNIIAFETIGSLLQAEHDAVLIKREHEDASRYGVAVVRGDTLVELVEKPAQPPSRSISTGIYLFSPAIFEFIEWELDLPGVIHRMLGAGRKIKAIETAGPWMDIVYPWDILKANAHILKSIRQSTAGTIETGVSIRGQVVIGNGTVIRANTYLLGPLNIGEGCDIGPNVCLFPETSIGNRVTIAPFSKISNSVIGEDTTIGAGSIIEDSIIDRGCRTGGRFTATSGETEIKVGGEYHKVAVGAIIGEHCDFGPNVVVAPGVIVGNRVKVKTPRTLDTAVPDGALVL